MTVELWLMKSLARTIGGQALVRVAGGGILTSPMNEVDQSSPFQVYFTK